MKKIVCFATVLTLTMAPFELNFSDSFTDSNSHNQASAVENDNLEVSANFEGVEVPLNTNIVTNKINDNLNSITNSLEELKKEDDSELTDLVNDISKEDLNIETADYLDKLKNEYSFENADIISREIKNDSEEKNSFTKANTVSAEENENEEIAEMEWDYADEEPTSLILDANVELNIVISSEDEEEYEVYSVEEYKEKVKEASKKETGFIKSKKAQAVSQAKIGWFYAAHIIALTDMKTKNAKFVNIGTITSVGGYKPKTLKVSLRTGYKNSSSKDVGYETVKTLNVANAKKSVDYQIASDVNYTHFWKAYASFKGIFPDGSSDTDSKKSKRFLLNKKGLPYPEYTDYLSQKKMHEPSSTKWERKKYPEEWGTTLRKKYRKWYDDKYYALHWEDYEVHHIRPRAWYGSNDYSNLIPLPKPFHQKSVSPWFVNY
ncbi:HNH endonuclease signature motif containing protein [Exiguobacterium artemiae]|uniref:HNH endonuclease signature motif containing protein n=1 Tax=Exiguobacterium artemiae TaxID=340145 RepID=UPI003D0246E9